MLAQRIFYWLADQLYPRFCVGCQKEGDDACDACLSSLAESPQWQDVDGLAVWSVYDYNGVGLGKYMQAWKYQGATDFIGGWLARLRWPKVEADIVVPVPLHRRKLLERGFNQAEQLAQNIAASMGIQLLPRALTRKRYTKAQALCDAALRRTNMIDAFTADPSLVAGKRILLVDDVVTTGSTLKEAEKALKQAGAKCVVAVCLARGG